MSRIQSSRVYVAPAGADLEDPAAWVEIGAARSDGYRPAPSTPEARNDYEAPASTSFNLQMPMTPRTRQLLFGNIAPPATPPFKGLREAIKRMRRNRVQKDRT